MPGFDKFRWEYKKGLYFVSMVEYEKDLPTVVAYPPIIMTNCFCRGGEPCAGLRQLHMAETENMAIDFFS